MAESERPVEVSPDDLKIEDLKALIDTGELPESVEVPVEAEPEKAEPEKEPDEQPAAEATPAEAEPEPEPEPPTEFDALRLQLEEAEKRVQHFEKVAGREAGAKGFLEQKLKKQESDIDELRRLVAERLQTDGELPPLDPQPAPRPEPAAPLSNETEAAVTQMLMEREAQRFMAAHPEAMKQDSEGNMINEFQDDLVAELQNYRADVENLLRANPVAAATGVHQLLETAWSKVDLDRTTAKRQDADRRRADSAQSLKEKKRAEAITPSGGAPSAPTRKPLDPMTMPIEDLKALIDGMNQE